LKNIINRVEKGLIRFAVLTLLLMVIIQGLMTTDPIRFYLSWGERMEGQAVQLPVSSSQEDSSAVSDPIKSPQAQLTISIDKYSSLPKAKILINGKENYNFTEKQVTIDVKANDSVEIDSRAYNFPINYKITASSSNLASPKQGQTLTANQTMVKLDEVIVK
jgi:hypothetical protein